MSEQTTFLENIHEWLNNFQVWETAAAGLVTALAGLFAIFFERLRSKSGTAEKDINRISEAVLASANEARSRAIEAIVEKLPSGISKEELENLVTQQIRVGGDFIINQQAPADRQLVEDLVTNYHQQALSQARVQFWFSVMAATIGFLYILYAASTADSSNPATYAKILPGVVIEAVAALFFRQAEQTRQRATELYDRLRKDRQMMRAESVVETIEDVSIRSAVKAQIALHMVGLVPKEIDLQSFLSKVGRPEKPDGQS
jgi:hypothetical protein